MTTPTASPAQLDALRSRIASILLGSSCTRITFRAGAVHIRPGGYTVIGMSVGTAPPQSGGTGSRRRMHVRVAGMPAHVGARYLARTNTIEVPHVNFGHTPWERQTIVHEATHAVYDYFRIRASAPLEEAGAYIAGACFEVLETRGGSASATGPIWNAARSIADDLFPHGGRLMPWDGDRVVDQTKLNVLLQAILSSPTYSAGIAQHPHHSYHHDGGQI